jgi:hypothetical protein
VPVGFRQRISDKASGQMPKPLIAKSLGEADCQPVRLTRSAIVQRQAAETQDDGKGQAIPLCQVPETQPEAREDLGAVVLPAVSGCHG